MTETDVLEYLKDIECVEGAVNYDWLRTFTPGLLNAMRVVCQLARERITRIDAEKPLLAESDLIEFYKERMVEHRNAAIASRKRAEAAEAEIILKKIAKQ